MHACASVSILQQACRSFWNQTHTHTLTHTQGKNEIAVELQRDESKGGEQPLLAEMRVFVPPPKEGEDHDASRIDDFLQAIIDTAQIGFGGR